MAAVAANILKVAVDDIAMELSPVVASTNVAELSHISAVNEPVGAIEMGLVTELMVKEVTVAIVELMLIKTMMVEVP